MMQDEYDFSEAMRFEELADRMVVMHCMIHGYLRIGQVVSNGFKSTRPNPKRYLKCKECHQFRMREHNKKPKIREQIQRRNQRNKRIQIDELRDNYIKKLLTHRTILKYEDIPDELVQLKRAQMQLQRRIKELTENNHDR